ncbi:MAG: DNA cytosine methyltransferase [Candidatus Porifericomitaceae bacterium WSBS_2022_MAG_OTU9]
MKCIDLFAGAGGLSCGLETAGFKVVLANEIVAQYANTYRENNPNTELVVDDVRQLCEKNLKKLLGLNEGELDLLAGGPPCQGFSVNAPIRSIDDSRNHLFKEFLRIAAAFLPKAILIENVPGIVQLGKGTVVEQIYKELVSLGYTVEHKILFAGHYGVPQMRFRAIFIAIRNKKWSKVAFPEPEYNASAVANFANARNLCINVAPLFAANLKDYTSVWKAISDLPEIKNGSKNGPLKYATQAESDFQKIVRNGDPMVENHSCANLGKINIDRLKHIPQGGSWRDIPVSLLPSGMKRARRSDHTKRYGRLHPDRLCSTVLTKCDPHWGSFFHPMQERIISVREAARIQSFPDSYKFTGTITQQYEQVGNAVPPLMVKAIGEKIITMIGS